MVWMALVPLALNAVSSLSAAATEEANAKASNTINEANAYANNLVRATNNKLRAARGSLARYNQSVNNQRTLENAGKQAEAAVVNYQRARDRLATDSFEQQISFAEQEGAQRAAAALSGLTGGVADIVASTTALRKERLQARVQEAEKQGRWDAQQMQKNIMQSGFDSLDTSELTDDLDYSVDVAVKRAPRDNFLSGLLAGQSSKSLADLAGGFFNTQQTDMLDPRAGVRGQRGYNATSG